MAIRSVVGWLPFGVTDESILFQADMKSAASITSNTGTITVVGSGTQTFDSVRGMNVGSSGGYRILQMTGYASLDYSGQISIEVQREYICKSDSTNDSVGDTLSSQGYVLSTAPGTGAAQAPLYKTTGGAVGAFMIGGTTNRNWARGSVDTGTTVNCQIHSAGKDDFVRIKVGWWGNHHVLAVNGHIVCAGNLSRSTIANVFNQSLYRLRSWCWWICKRSIYKKFTNIKSCTDVCCSSRFIKSFNVRRFVCKYYEYHCNGLHNRDNSLV